MKKLLPLLLLTPVAHAESVTFDDTLEFIKDTFNVMYSKSDYSDEHVFTLKASYNFTEDFRVFGEWGTDDYKELGLGYSILTDNFYNELTGSIGHVESDFFGDMFIYKAGLFTATIVGQVDTVVFGSFDVVYKDTVNQLPIANFETDTISLDKTIGISQTVTPWLDVMAALNHNKDHYYRAYFGNWKLNDEAGYYDFYSTTGLTFNYKGVKPSIIYNFYGDENRNYFEFGLSADF